jgi:site-specific DNA recombinase
VPLGYDQHPDPNRRELVVNGVEAETVRRLFSLYLDHGCLNATAVAAEAATLRSKRRVFANGRVQGGGAFSRGQIHKILTNPVYRGLTRHKDKTWPGTHPAIVDEDLWAQVQQRLQAASARRRGSRSISGASCSGNHAPLMGKVRDETGDLLTPTHTQPHGRRLRYYVSNRLLTGTRDTGGWRLPAPAFEQAVAVAIAGHLEARAVRHRVLRNVTAAKAEDSSAKARSLAEAIRQRGVSAIALAILSGTVSAGGLRIALDRATLADHLALDPADLDSDLLDVAAPFTCRRRGIEVKIVSGDREATPDRAMLRALRNAHRWAAMLKAGVALGDIADRDGASESYVGRIIPLATLSPRIQDAIVTGSQPLELSLETLVRSRPPLDWVEQERRFGFTT